MRAWGFTNLNNFISGLKSSFRTALRNSRAALGYPPGGCPIFDEAGAREAPVPSFSGIRSFFGPNPAFMGAHFTLGKSRLATRFSWRISGVNGEIRALYNRNKNVLMNVVRSGSGRVGRFPYGRTETYLLLRYGLKCLGGPFPPTAERKRIYGCGMGRKWTGGSLPYDLYT